MTIENKAIPGTSQLATSTEMSARAAAGSLSAKEAGWLDGFGDDVAVTSSTTRASPARVRRRVPGRRRGRYAPVLIDDGAWLGQNLVVCPGVRIGKGAVVGANSVVLSNVPDNAVAVGAPARIVRSG